ncbi:hypothetical protein [Natrinema soli]|uniref:Uncharacterized protein n=1 Tax=Natrinema soli TaxID=1930624 RepID=A0ABD5SF25_9EURY|nr:hypothetical protein [Natrinema soli]
MKAHRDLQEKKKKKYAKNIDQFPPESLIGHYSGYTKKQVRDDRGFDRPKVLGRSRIDRRVPVGVGEDVLHVGEASVLFAGAIGKDVLTNPVN